MKKKTGKDVKNEKLEDDKDCDDSDDSDNEDSLKHGIDHTASENQRATKKMKSSNSTPDPTPALSGYAVSTAVDLQMPQMVR